MTTARVVVARRAGVNVVVELDSRAPVGLRPLQSRDDRAPARVAIVQIAGGLAGGDDVRLDVQVGAGATLELVELSATLAHPVAAPRPAIHQAVRIHVGAGGRLQWLAEPLILSAGTRLARHVGLDLEDGGRALLGETVVLGRDGEAPGQARCRTRIIRDGRPIFDDTVVTGDDTVSQSAAVIGAARVCAALTLVGVAPPLPLPAGAMSLTGRDTTLRVLAGETVDSSARLAVVADAWGGTLHGG